MPCSESGEIRHLYVDSPLKLKIYASKPLRWSFEYDIGDTVSQKMDRVTTVKITLYKNENIILFPNSTLYKNNPQEYDIPNILSR